MIFPFTQTPHIKHIVNIIFKTNSCNRKSSFIWGWKALIRLNLDIYSSYINLISLKFNTTFKKSIRNKLMYIISITVYLKIIYILILINKITSIPHSTRINWLYRFTFKSFIRRFSFTRNVHSRFILYTFTDRLTIFISTK